MNSQQQQQNVVAAASASSSSEKNGKGKEKWKSFEEEIGQILVDMNIELRQPK